MGSFQTYGWQDWQSNGESAGTTGQAKRLEALEATLGGGTVSGDMEYRTHVQSIGWQGWVANGATAGTTGQAKRLEAACIRLTGLAERYFDVWYRVHSQTYGWMGWTKNGAPAGTEGLSKRLEAIQVVIKPKGSVAPGSTVGSFRNTPRSLVMVGDSRTLGTYEALYGTSRVDDIIVEECDGNGTWWIMRNGAGYNWLNLAAASSVDGRISADSSVVIWLGVNDIIGFDQQMEILQYSDEAHYAELINSKAREWTSRGAMVYYATVGPLGSTGGTDYYSVPYTNRVVSDAQVRSWNSNLVPLLSSDVRVIDAYGALVGNFATSEGLHYDDATYLRYYEFVRRSVL